jgi:hypothetical protein
MSERNDNRERLLDETLRRMVAGEGPADLPQRVMARLDAPRRPVFSPVWATAAVTVIAIALGLWLWRDPQPVPSSQRATGAEPSPSIGPSTPLAPSPNPVEPAARETRRAARQGSVIVIEGDDPAVPPLPPPEPLAVAALEPDPIAIEPVPLDPLAPIADLTVEPLADPEHERKE